MKLFELKKGEIKLQEVPGAPDGLNEYGEEAWRIYCEVLFEQGRLYKEYLMGLKHLCWLEGKLEQSRQEMEEDFNRTIKEFSVDARQYREAYGLTEKSRPTISGEEQQKSSKKAKNF